MSTSYTTYVYTPLVPLDAIVNLTKRAVREALGRSGLRFTFDATDTDGVYTLHFKEPEGQNRTLWLMTQIYDDFPKASRLAEAGITPDPRIGEKNDGFLLSMGSFGKAKEIMDEVGTALSFLGPVVHKDEGLSEDQELFVTPAPLALEDVLERYRFSLYRASNLLMGLRRGGVRDHLDLEAFVDGVKATVEDSVERGGFAKARAAAIETPGM